ncbi:hypothetical protein KC19_3G172700 [Ceratodon purpureus]|uniref:RING-type E3 ubiquitin transferase n=1 Tax=Ceratodon purpureus TaxID=3225 RepID=A0A8T0INB4_CERPU|nr:hypothetical protein KC19_3G172700 [Ceratodon purpureus]
MSTLYLGVTSRLQSFPPPPILETPMLQVRQLQQTASKPHINPSILVIVIILSVVFICSGVLHILARCLGRRRASAPAGDFNSPSNSIRGQLQHLFSLHDSGVEQVFIDTLPVFLYGSIRGLKDSADCAVCLNEFANEDRLRLLPKCKHAFHVECIDTWLLSNSTCPLCRRSLLLEAEAIVFANSDSNRESNACAGVLSQEEAHVGSQSQRHGSFRGSFRASLRGSFRFITDAVLPTGAPAGVAQPEREILPNPVLEEEDETPPMTPGPTVCVTKPDGSEKVLRVELGKVNTDSRRISRDVGTSRGPRSYSMGSYEYVVDFSSLGLPMQPEDWAGSKPTHRTTLSDSIPELASASHTPGQEDMFWARRGLETPHNLSRVREMMTPSPGWLFESPKLPQQERAQQVVNINHEEELEDDAEQGEIQALSRKRSADQVPKAPGNQHEEAEKEVDLAPSLSLRFFPIEDKIEACSPLPETPQTPQELAAALRKDKVWEVSVDVAVPSTSEGSGKSTSSSKKSSPLNWLRGRGRRLVYSAASPSTTEMQSPESKVT